MNTTVNNDDASEYQIQSLFNALARLLAIVWFAGNTILITNMCSEYRTKTINKNKPEAVTKAFRLSTTK